MSKEIKKTQGNKMPTAGIHWAVCCRGLIVS